MKNFVTGEERRKHHELVGTLSSRLYLVHFLVISAQSQQQSLLLTSSFFIPLRDQADPRLIHSVQTRTPPNAVWIFLISDFSRQGLWHEAAQCLSTQQMVLPKWHVRIHMPQGLKHFVHIPNATKRSRMPHHRFQRTIDVLHVHLRTWKEDDPKIGERVWKRFIRGFKRPASMTEAAILLQPFANIGPKD